LRAVDAVPSDKPAAQIKEALIGNQEPGSLPIVDRPVAILRRNSFDRRGQPMNHRSDMFVRNCWYCAGWDYHLTQGKNSLLARRIANEPLVLYRKPDGAVVAMEDRCCHRQAPLHLGQKEGDALRCMYHGMKFGPDGICIEIPGQEKIPQQARVRTFPVVERDT